MKTYLPTALKKNIESLYGEEGKQWLIHLPETINELSRYWDLSNIQPFPNMSYHYVAQALQHQKLVVIKMGYDENAVRHEAKTLQLFEGQGMVELLDLHPTGKAMLLKQAIPGHSLKSVYPDHFDEVIKAYASVIHAMPRICPENHNEFEHIQEWLKAIDRADQSHFQPGEIDKGIALKEKLLSDTHDEYLLHGDLHLDNALKDGDVWVAIDPKGIMGNIYFEVACFDFIDESEYTRNDVSELLKERIKRLANATGLNASLLEEWVFIRSILKRCWMIEDHIL